MFCGGLKVFVDARKSIGTELTEPEPAEPELDVGRDKERDGGRMGFSELKKSDLLFLMSGELGMFCNVSMVRSDKDGRGFRTGVCSSGTGFATFGCASSCLESSRIVCPRRTDLEGFRKRPLSLGFRYCSC